MPGQRAGAACSWQGLTASTPSLLRQEILQGNKRDLLLVDYLNPEVRQEISQTSRTGQGGWHNVRKDQGRLRTDHLSREEGLAIGQGRGTVGHPADGQRWLLNLQGEHAIKESARGQAFDSLKQFREQTGHPRLLTAQVKLGVGVVALAGQDDQILGRIVGAVPIPVVHDLTGQERSAEQPLCLHPVRQQTFARFWVPDLAVLFATFDGSPPLLTVRLACLPRVQAESSLIEISR